MMVLFRELLKAPALHCIDPSGRKRTGCNGILRLVHDEIRKVL
ncbi:MAG TPA: hypothetical protein VL098_02595 [Flavipsychrobacter sp.]|nr:hypothetical protein [Flavipsychrobacter sp.]